MRISFYIATAGLAVAFVAFSGSVDAQRQDARSVQNEMLPLCRDAEAGERCRTRNGTVRVRRGQRAGSGNEPGLTNNLGGGDPGWEVRGEGDTEPRGEAPGQVRQPDVQNFGGADVGFITGRGGNAPEPEAMDCELCDDDEDTPQGPIDNTPRPDTRAPQGPDGGEDDDCEWHNPAGGPDQEFCDE
ncbi:hypothetical protein HXX25_11765 [Hyphobacterium sp. CCMP332]|uniref:hypothetical protein n=1 Tax=Hyphobacterium sp. CCMP332 TaxID=2749086 RepID=UPI001650B051|nr:hypothetical protein [Hyphobacterium sp. CCMP332]QNL19943.1 hypothetical protein HXX25_11765 [Hyphobacterium sp. CCMP332]